MTDQVVISGIGLITSLGSGVQTVLDAMHNGVNGFIDRSGDADCSKSDLVVARVAPELVSWPDDPEWINREKYANRQSHLAVSVAQQTIRSARLQGFEMAAIDPLRSGVVMTSGTSSNDELGSLLPRLASESRTSSKSLSEFLYDEVPDYSYIKGIPSQIGQFVSDVSNFRGSNVAVYGEGSSGGVAGLSLALDLILSGELDRVMVVGVSVLPSMTLADAFSRVEPLSPVAVDGAGPFDVDRRGSLLGEAAVAIIVERRGLRHDSAMKKPMQFLNVATAVAPSTRESFKAVLDALGNDVSGVDLWWANGAGARQLDLLEAEVGASATKAPVTASKGTIGSALECSTLIDVALAREVVGEDLIPPIGLTSQVDPYLGDIDVVAGEPRQVDSPINSVLITGLAHGWDCPSAGAVVIRNEVNNGE